MSFIPNRGSDVHEGDTDDMAPERITRREVREIPPVSEVDEFEDPEPDAARSPESPAAAGDVPPRPTAIYRSGSRPEMAILTAVDDGTLDDGRKWRIYGDRFVIGRTESDCTIPHDNEISKAHAEITRESHGQGFVWHLADLSSMNGTFLQVRRAFLRHGRELLLGGRRYEFQSPRMTNARLSADEAQDTQLRQGLNGVPQPRLVELTDNGPGRVIPLDESMMRLGSDPRCEIVVDDPFLSGRHARIACDSSGRWCIADCDSLNGVLVRVSRVSIEVERRFQIGGQRFILRIV